MSCDCLACAIAGRLPWRRREPRDRVATDDGTPILAHRMAYLAPVGGRWDRLVFRSVGVHGTFGVLEHARCIRNDNLDERAHSAPRFRCSCGFYAVPPQSSVWDYEYRQGSSVLLEVQLYGRVIICSGGYRAEWQEVVGVKILPCASCQESRTWFRISMGGENLVFRCRCSGAKDPTRPWRTWRELPEILGLPVEVLEGDAK